MPSFPFVGARHLEYLKQRPTYDVRRTPSRVGLLTEVFRRWPGAQRSLDPDLPVVAWGGAAKAVVGDAPSNQDPWGPDSSFQRMLTMGGTVVGLGVSLNTNSFIPVIDSRFERRYGMDIFCAEVFPAEVRDYDDRSFLVTRKAVRPEVNALWEMSALVEKLGDRRDVFSSLQINGVQFFRWELRRWQECCLEHCDRRLKDGQLPCWLRRIR